MRQRARYECREAFDVRHSSSCGEGRTEWYGDGGCRHSLSDRSCNRSSLAHTVWKAERGTFYFLMKSRMSPFRPQNVPFSTPEWVSYWYFWWFPDRRHALELATQALEETRVRFTGGVDDEADAWRHARWMELTMRDCGWLTAWCAGTGHEIENHFAGAPRSSIAMDLYNNSRGRSGTPADELLKEGRLQLTPNRSLDTPEPPMVELRGLP